MSTPTIPPPGRRRKGARPVADPRPVWRCACHAPLSADTWDNRRARLVVRRRRCSAASRHVWRDFYSLARELEVWLPFLHPRTVLGDRNGDLIHDDSGRTVRRGAPDEGGSA